MHEGDPGGVGSGVAPLTILTTGQSAAPSALQPFRSYFCCINQLLLGLKTVISVKDSSFRRRLLGPNRARSVSPRSVRHGYLSHC